MLSEKGPITASIALKTHQGGLPTRTCLPSKADRIFRNFGKRNRAVRPDLNPLPPRPRRVYRHRKVSRQVFGQHMGEANIWSDISHQLSFAHASACEILPLVNESAGSQRHKRNPVFLQVVLADLLITEARNVRCLMGVEEASL